ncbi:hypothetical protein Tco_1417290 [Tanacetum coccineum]
MVPRAVLMKSGLVSINTARQVNAAHTKTTVNAARPMSYLSKKEHLTINMPIHKNTTFKNRQSTNRFIRSRSDCSGCSRHMTGNMSYLTDYEEIDGGYVAFGGNLKGGKITRKSTIKTGGAGQNEKETEKGDERNGKGKSRKERKEEKKEEQKIDTDERRRRN